MRTYLVDSVGVLLLAGCGDTSARPDPGPLEQSVPPLEVFATGAEISGANGIHFAPDGLLYITSVVGSDMTVLDTSTGEIVERPGVADGVIGPDAVAFASDGS